MMMVMLMSMLCLFRAIVASRICLQEVCRLVRARRSVRVLIRSESLTTLRVSAFLEVFDDSIYWHNDDRCDNGEEEIEDRCENFVYDAIEDGGWWERLELWDGEACSGIMTCAIRIVCGGHLGHVADR